MPEGPEAHPALAGQFTRAEAEDVATSIADDVYDQIREVRPGNLSELRWRVEDAVIAAFGFEGQEDEPIDAAVVEDGE